MLPELTQDEFSCALDTVAADVLEAVGLAGPPIDALSVARALGLAVAWDAQQQGRGRFVRLSRFGGGQAQGSILLKPEPRQERLQWAVAHEIGETCAHRVFDSLGVDAREAPSGAREAVANHFASRLLLPRRWFAAHARGCDWDLFELKQRYATVSHELIARRMLDFAPPITITIFDHGRRALRKSNLPAAPKMSVPAEMAAWRAAHDGGQTEVKESRLCRVQAWPVHEPEWKREILRTEWLADDDGHDVHADDADAIDF